MQAESNESNTNIALEKVKNKLVKMVQALGVGQQMGGTRRMPSLSSFIGTLTNPFSSPSELQ